MMKSQTKAAAREFEGTAFETEMPVRPDDIDMNRHVHSSRYFDYVLAARYEQMARCYKMSMEQFQEAGFGWVVRTAQLEFKRPLSMGDVIVVRTRITRIFKHGVRVRFEIVKKNGGKLSCCGTFDYTMISAVTGRAETIPGWIAEKYSI